MDEIYVMKALKENLWRIENMTVREIREHLAEGCGFLIYGDADWAVLTREDIESTDL